MKDVTVFEVGPRDGLQNEARIVPTDSKIRFIQLLAASGLRKIEATSFVRPGVIPQMSDAAGVYGGIRGINGPIFSALVPNARGMEQALECGVQEVAVFTAASETFTKNNINCSIQESIDRFSDVMRMAQSHGIPVRGYVSTVVQCPYEGPVNPQNVAELCSKLIDLGVYEVSLGETIGAAVPEDVDRLLSAVLPSTSAAQVACHFHDTRGTALANVYRALDAGIRTFDASAGGLGGCPYAPGASGNLATEDLLYALQKSGYSTGIDVEKIVEASSYMAGILQKTPASRAYAAIVAARAAATGVR